MNIIVLLVILLILIFALYKFVFKKTVSAQIPNETIKEETDDSLEYDPNKFNPSKLKIPKSFYNTYKPVANCDKINKLNLDMHIMTNFSFTIGNRVVKNDLKESDLSKLMNVINKIWSNGCVKWTMDRHYVENMTSNYTKYYTDITKFNEKKRALDYMMNSLDVSKHKLMFRNELYKFIDIDVLDSRIFRVYIYPYLGDKVEGLVTNNDGIVINIGYWNNVNGLKKLNINELGRIISKYLGYCLGLLSSKIEKNLMNNGDNISKNQKLRVMDITKPTLQESNKPFIIDYPINLTPSYEIEGACKITDNIHKLNCIHVMFKKVQPVKLYRKEQDYYKEVLSEDMFDLPRPCFSDETYMDKIKYPFI